MRDSLLIYLNGTRREITGDRVFRSLSNFLRYDLGLIGTKVVCAEGDCGSCAVLIGRVLSDTNVYRPVTSCIQFLYQLDGAHVITIEGLKQDGKLNAIQDAMVRCQGTQCGFCTPGFIVSMCGLMNENAKIDEQSLRHGLCGNLCRCTGYESIIKAGIEAASAKRVTLNQMYPPASMIDELRRAQAEPVRVESCGKLFFKPTTIADAARFKADHPSCMIIAGGTDVGVQINKGMRDPDVILSTAAISELRGLSIDAHRVFAGALVTLSELERAVESINPQLGQMLWRHGSPLIRNAGTLAGNIANGSPIGDSMPALYVLDGEIELTGQSGSRRVNINDFYTGYRQTCAASDELITRVIFPLPQAGEDFRLCKISKRHDLDISTFTAAFWMKREANVISDLRIAYGGCGPNIIRLRKTEQALIGKPFTEPEIDSAAEVARNEIMPISDVRGSADYRLLLAENVLKKFYFDVTGEPTYQRATPPATVALKKE